MKLYYLIFTLLSISSFFIIVSCSGEPEPINYGEDHCSYCEMKIMDKKFGSELVSKKGKIYKFDSVECLAAFVNEGETVKSDNISSMWVTDYLNPENFLTAENSVYYVGKNIKSPMGLYISAFQTEEKLLSVTNTDEGKKLNWSNIKEYVKEEWEQ